MIFNGLTDPEGWLIGVDTARTPKRSVGHDPLNVASYHRAEPVPPEVHRLMAKVDAASETQILYIPLWICGLFAPAITA
jgi:hypothetical protein